MDAAIIIKTEELTDCDNAAAAADQPQEVNEKPPTKKQRRSTSDIWQYFTTCDDDVTKVVCNICKRVMSRGKDFGHLTTTTMHNHMRYQVSAALRAAGDHSQPLPLLLLCCTVHQLFLTLFRLKPNRITKSPRQSPTV